MSQRVTEQLYTAKEFERLPEFNERYELIYGKLVEKPMPRFQHSRVAKKIMLALHELDPEEKLGVMLQEVSVEIRDNYAPAPDLSFWIASRKPDEEVDLAPMPDLAIEIQSKGQGVKELLDKAREYQKAGVRLVWVIQPTRKIAAVFHHAQKSFITVQPTGELDGEDVIPGFKLKLNEYLFK